MLQSQLIKGRILSALLMFCAAWLHLQRETLIAVSDYTSGCWRLSSGLRIWLLAQLWLSSGSAPTATLQTLGFDSKVGKKYPRASIPVFFLEIREHPK